MAETLDQIIESYASRRVRERLDGWQQRRALEEEADWFRQTRELLAQLDQAVGDGDPVLSRALDLLERKQLEQGLVEAWTHWHGGQGDPVEAAKSLSAFLCTSGAQSIFDPNAPDDRVLHYTQALLRALLDLQLAVPLFDAQRPMPSYLAGSLLARYLSEYERFRAARGRSHAGTDGL